MSENNNAGGSGIGCLGPFVGIAGLVAFIGLGPIDLGRSIYNQIIGDTPVLKRQLLDYSRRDIQRNSPNYTQLEVEKKLANELNYELTEERIDPQKVSIEKFDLSCLYQTSLREL
jgi:hypothetical protein